MGRKSFFLFPFYSLFRGFSSLLPPSMIWGENNGYTNVRTHHKNYRHFPRKDKKKVIERDPSYLKANSSLFKKNSRTKSETFLHCAVLEVESDKRQAITIPAAIYEFFYLQMPSAINRSLAFFSFLLLRSFLHIFHSYTFNIYPFQYSCSSSTYYYSIR